MSDIRYARHHALPEFGREAQQRLAAARVLLIGAGGLGCAAGAYLAAAGVGRLTVADFDTVDTANLQRQILYTTDQVGADKAPTARDRLHALNPEIEVIALRERLDDARLEQAAADADAVVDGCDNFATRFAANRAAVRHGLPLVSGAAIRWQGQLAVFDTARAPEAGCYACLFDETAMDEDMGDCARNGVLGPLVGVIGSLQAVETLKLLTDRGEARRGRLVRYDAGSGDWRESRLVRDPGCPVCGEMA